MKVIKTLVIHPYDKTTDFLVPTYMNIKSFPDFDDATVIRGGMTRDRVEEQIKQHDRIMMMGHGSPYGLFSIGQFGPWSYIIDGHTVPLLKDKECIFIWCNADRFVETHNLKGLYSGMFISEVMEANYCGLPGTSQDIVDESNNFFASEFGKVSHLPLNEAFEYIKEEYEQMADFNPVARYNNNRLYLKS